MEKKIYVGESRPLHRFLWGPYLYYVSIFLDFFWPTHYVGINTVLNICKNGHFLTPPTQSFCWRNIGMVPRQLGWYSAWRVRPKRERTCAHGSRYIIAQYCDLGSGVFNLTRCSVVIWHIQEGSGIGHESGHSNAIIYSIYSFIIIVFSFIYDQDIKKQKKLYCKKKTDFSFLSLLSFAV